MTGFWTLVRRDLALALREGSAVGTALGFYLLVVALMPLGLGPDLKLLGRIAPGVLWIALLLAALLSLPRMFEADHEDGSLEVMATAPLPLELAAAAKALAHWISTGIPLAILAPVLGILLNLDLAAYPAARRDDARRHARHQLSRRRRCRTDAARAPWRPAARASRAAPLRPDPDFRYLGHELRCLLAWTASRRRS